MSEKLLPCPVCRKPAISRGFHEAEGYRGASCPDSWCLLGGGWYPIPKWNTRPTPPDLREADIGRWKAEELEWQKWEVRYRAALIGLLSNPHGCSLCDSGKPRNTAKGHQPNCPYEVARACLPPDAIAALQPQEQK